MRRMAVLLAFAAALLGAESAQACTCVPVPPDELLDRADGAVVARHLAVRPIEGSVEVDFVYRVGRVYKHGPGLRRGRRIAVRTLNSDAICGLSPSIGHLSGLFLYRSDGRWRSGSCGQTSPNRMRDAGGCDKPSASP
jgi:hypothetical protein